MFPRFFFSLWQFAAGFFPVGGALRKAMAGRLDAYPRYQATASIRPKLTAAAHAAPRLSGTFECST